MTTLCRGNAQAFCLSWCFIHGFLRPQTEHEERFSFLFRLPSGRSIKYATFLSCLEWITYEHRREKRKDFHVRNSFRLEKCLCGKIRHVAWQTVPQVECSTTGAGRRYRKKVKMTVIGQLFSPPDMNSEKDWMLPRYLRASYFVNLSLGLVTLTIATGYFIFSVLKNEEMLVALGYIMLASIVYVAMVCVWGILCRLMYEVSILLFALFHSQRDTVRNLEVMNDTLAQIVQMQLKSGQYTCDRLAEICDLLKGIDRR